jgi:hypothetical protein
VKNIKSLLNSILFDGSVGVENRLNELTVVFKNVKRSICGNYKVVARLVPVNLKERDTD